MIGLMVREKIFRKVWVFFFKVKLYLRLIFNEFLYLIKYLGFLSFEFLLI